MPQADIGYFQTWQRLIYRLSCWDPHTGATEVQYIQARSVIDDIAGNLTAKVMMAAVAQNYRNIETPCFGRKVRNGIHVHPFNVCLRGDQQVDRAINAPVRRPITGMTSGQHLLVETGVNHDDKQVFSGSMKKGGYIERECCISFAKVLSSLLPIDPYRCRVKHGFEFNSNRLFLPARSHFKLSPVPSYAKISGRIGGRLPSMRNGNLIPSLRWSFRFFPVPGAPEVVWIEPKLPASVQGYPRGPNRACSGGPLCIESSFNRHSGRQGGSCGQELSARKQRISLCVHVNAGA